MIYKMICVLLIIALALPVSALGEGMIEWDRATAGPAVKASPEPMETAAFFDGMPTLPPVDALKTEGQNSFREYFLESMTPIVFYFFEDVSEDELDRDIIVNMFCDAFLSAIIRWLEMGCRITPKELMLHIRRMVKVIAESADGWHLSPS